MRQRLLWIFLLIAAFPLAAETSKFRPLADGAAVRGRYRVALDTSLADDRELLVRQLLSVCRCRLEPYAEAGFDGVMITASPAAAELLSRDPRVISVEEIAAGAEPPPVPAAPSAPRPLTPVADATVFWERTYAYDQSGNVKQAGADDYRYDRIGRLTYAEAGAGKRQEYTYDRYGNILSIAQDGGAADPLSVEARTNRLIAGTVSVQYDDAGRMDQRNGAVFRYDGTDAVVEDRNGGQRRIHLYSATDERIATMLVDNAGNESSSSWTIRDTAGAVLRRFVRKGGNWSWDEDYIYRDGRLLAAEVSSAARTLHFHADHLGTPRVITGSGGAVVEQHDYYAFGKQATPAASPQDERHKFTGHERDAADLDYMHARYYSPVWGRFLSVDPVRGDRRVPQSWNRYAYALGNPINYTDPTGMTTEGGPIIITPTSPPDNSEATGSSTPGTLQDFWRFISGFANAAGSDAVLGFGRVEATSDAFQAGQTLGDVFSILNGIQEIAGGLGLEAGGVALDATGVGAVLGVQLNGAGAVLLLHGGSRVFIGSTHLMSRSGGGKTGKKINENRARANSEKLVKLRELKNFYDRLANKCPSCKAYIDKIQGQINRALTTLQKSETHWRK